MIKIEEKELIHTVLTLTEEVATSNTSFLILMIFLQLKEKEKMRHK